MADAAATAPQQPKTSGGGKAKKTKQANPNVVIPQKKPKLTKAERRAQQEAQRATKESGGGGKGSGAKQGKGGGGDGGGTGDKGKGKKATADIREDGNGIGAVGMSNDKTPSLFSHLQPYRGKLCQIFRNV